MQPVRLSKRLILGARILPRPLLTRRPAVCSSQHQRRPLSRSACLHDRGFAFPTEAREPASQDGHLTAQPILESSTAAEPLKIHRQKSGIIREDAIITPSSFITTTSPDTAWHPAYLRDMCRCPRCRDPSSTQKTFQTTDIPENLKARSVEVDEEGDIKITWDNDIPGFGPDHVSSFSKHFLHRHLTQQTLADTRFEPPEPRLWSRTRITRELRTIKYEDYMKEDEALYHALLHLNIHGILLLKDVPESETAVEDITSRMGTLRDTFYGRTWDVKSVPEAKNVAYTQQRLGLHMDLLYMANPPGLQLLHCLKNTCEGGSSLFSDAFYAVSQLHQKHVTILSGAKIGYQYKNAGEYYYHEHPVIERRSYRSNTDPQRRVLKHVNYSPPFQADHIATAFHQSSSFPSLLKSLRKFADRIEDPINLYEYKMQEGECVIFNNRRVLHGRKEFDTTHGERWLKGAYVDTDVFMSRFRVLNEKYELKGVEILENYVDLDAGISPPTGPKEKKPINYGSPFKKKEKKGPIKEVYVDAIA